MVNVFFNGRLGADAEVRQAKDGGQFMAFSVAVNEFRDGEEKTSWMRVYTREERLIKLSQHLKKGSLVSINGKEQVNLFTDKNGETQAARDVTAFNISFVRVGVKNENEVKMTMDTTTPEQNQEMNCGVLKPQLVTAPSSSTIDDDDELPF